MDGQTADWNTDEAVREVADVETIWQDLDLMQRGVTVLLSYTLRAMLKFQSEVIV